MNKNLFGIKLSVILTICLCLAASFLIWLYVSLSSIPAPDKDDTPDDPPSSTEQGNTDEI